MWFRNWNVAQAAIGHKIFLCPCPWLGCVQTFPSEQCISGLPIVPIFFCKIYLFLVKLIYFQTSPKAQRTVCWGLSCPLETSLAWNMINILFDRTLLINFCFKRFFCSSFKRSLCVFVHGFSLSNYCHEGGVSRGSRVPHTYFEKWFLLKTI